MMNPSALNKSLFVVPHIIQLKNIIICDAFQSVSNAFICYRGKCVRRVEHALQLNVKCSRRI